MKKREMFSVLFLILVIGGALALLVRPEVQAQGNADVWTAARERPIMLYVDVPDGNTNPCNLVDPRTGVKYQVPQGKALVIQSYIKAGSGSSGYGWLCYMKGGAGDVIERAKFWSGVDYASFPYNMENGIPFYPGEMPFLQAPAYQHSAFQFYFYGREVVYY